MKIAVLMVVLGVSLSACGEHRPISSPCFGPSGNATCKFVPLPELHAKGIRNGS